MVKTWPFKDTEEVLDYTIDWSTRPLSQGEQIVTSTWSWTPVDGNLVETTNSFTGTTTTIWLSGGAIGTKYVLTNQIVTNGGTGGVPRTMEQSVSLKIKEK